MSYNYDNVTFLMCLPRSRSYWLSQFFSSTARTMHDPLANCESIDELGTRVDRAIYMDRPIFVADTTAVRFFDQIDFRFPNARYLFVQRDTYPVYHSLRKAGILGLSAKVLDQWQDAMADAENACRIGRRLHYHVSFPALNDHLRNIWRFVGVQTPMSEHHARSWIGRWVVRSVEDQAAALDPEKMRKLFASIGVDYRTGSV